MISKNDVTTWFKTLESYKRIDTMCALLNICLPFELRFLGTCLEELGRRDSQELRGMELRVNKPQDLATDINVCQKGEPTDMKVRRRVALCLALMRVCNRTCVNEIFRILESWGELDFSSVTDKDILEELLLVYTMAANHPVFDFEQHMKAMQIFEKIKENKLVADSATPIPSPQNAQVCNPQHSTSHLEMSMAQHPHPPPHNHTELLHQHAAALHAATMHSTGQHPQLLAPNPMQMVAPATIPLNYPQGHLTKLLNASDGSSLQHPIAVDGMPHMIPANLTIPDSSNAVANTILTHPNVASWAMRQYHPAPPPPASTQVLVDHPPQSSSPMLSQQSSPSSSRTTSPNRTSSCDSNMLQNQSQPPPLTSQTTTSSRNMSQRIVASSLKNVRRPSAETTPPPAMGQQQQLITNELILPQNMKHISEAVMNNESSSNQLQNLIRNGFTRTANHPRIKAGNYIPPHQQQQQQQSPINQQQHYQGAFNAVNAGLSYAMQNMSISDMSTAGGGHHSIDGNAMMSMNSNKSTGSDSGSSIGSCGEISPPETPTLMMNSNATTNPPALRGDNQGQQITQQQQQQPQKHHQPSQLSYNKQISLSRLNGRADKLMAANAANVASVTGVGGNVVNANAMIYAQQQQQQIHQQATTPQALYADILLASGGNAGGTNVMQQSSLTNSNGGGGGGGNPNANVVSTNNNMLGNNTVLISSPSSGAGNLGGVITSNSVILSHQQQYNATYPYHAAAAAAQHLAASSARPPLMAHNPTLAPPPHGTFRLPGFQIPNGELIYQTYHPAGGITFLSGAAPPGVPPAALRTTNSGAAVVSSQAISQPPTPQQIPPPIPQQLQSTSSAAVLASPYSTLTVGLSNKPVSCYNCGSQSHSGRECQEASMDDVTRSAIYKLDYNQAASGAGAAGAVTPATQQQQIANSASDTATGHSQKSHDTSGVIGTNASVVATVAASSSTTLTVTASTSAK
uniref:CCHC-type domain-containing protein n=1 Tax=Glossina brevipalpis TaxID=37001 RepID=A0A1A9W033_9MUSC